MSNKSNLFLTFAVGALAGAAITALFTTEQGKKILSKAKDMMDEFSEEMKEKMNDFGQETAENFNQQGQSTQS